MSASVSGRDAEFPATHRPPYERTIRQMQAQLLRLQISRGDLANAQHTLTALKHPPFHFWLLLQLPAAWAGPALDGYRRVHRTARRWFHEPFAALARHESTHAPR